MSAGDSTLTADHDLSKCAPKFQEAIKAAVEECNEKGFDAYVYEACRSDDLAKQYYARGRTVKPPTKPVTNAPTAKYSWHGFGLAADVISKAHDWDVPTHWFEGVSMIMKKHGLKWGGDWTTKDLPHFQWSKCKASPSQLARTTLANEGVEAVWKLVGAE